MVLGLLASGDMGLLTTGCEGFVRPIERRYRDLGGEITYGATVEKILVSGGKAVGVRLANGEEVAADAVISAADGYSTIFGMLDGRYGDDALRARYRDWKLIKPWVMISFGVAREFPGEPHFTTYRLAEPFTVGAQRVESLGLRIFNYAPTFAPAGKTVIQPAFETEWTYWNDLRAADRGRYEAEKERVAAEVLRRLEAHYPGLVDPGRDDRCGNAVHHLALHPQLAGRVRGLAADRQPDDDGPAAHTARPGEFRHGRAVGDTGRRCADVPALRP